MGSYGSRWAHGWIPLNAAATAIKAKQLRGGDKEHHSAEHHGGFQHIVAHTGSGRHGSLIVDPSGAGHYKAFDTRAQAISDGAEHLATLRGAHNAKALVSSAPRDTLRIRPGTYRGENGHHISGSPAGDNRSRKIFAPGDRAEAEKVRDNVRAGRDPFAHHKSETPAMQKVVEHAQDRHRANEAKRVASEEAKVTEASKPEFTRQEMMLPGVRVVGDGGKIIVRPSVRMHNAGHRFPLAGGPSPMVEHGEFAVEHSNGAHLGHIDTNGGLHITGPGLPRHEVKSVKQALAGLHANFTIRQREDEAKKAAEAAKADSAKAAQEASRSQQQELRVLAQRVIASQGGRSTKSSEYTAAEKMLRGLDIGRSRTHEEKRAELKAMVRKYSEADLRREGLFALPKATAPKPRVTKTDTPAMEANRAKIARATERSQPLELSGTFGEDAAATIREGLPVTHGGIAGHVVGNYGSTFDTFHPRDEQGRGGYYMRHEITTRRGRKRLNSYIAQHSGAKAG